MQSKKDILHRLKFTMDSKLYAFYEKIAEKQKISTEEVMEKFLTFWAERGFRYGHFDTSINPFMSEHKLESIEKFEYKKK